MELRTTRALALQLWALAALNTINPIWVLSEAVTASAAPLAQEETVYRPVCPDDEVSTGWVSCRLTLRSGGAARPGDGEWHGRHD